MLTGDVAPALLGSGGYVMYRTPRSVHPDRQVAQIISDLQYLQKTVTFYRKIAAYVLYETCIKMKIYSILRNHVMPEKKSKCTFFIWKILLISGLVK